MKTIVIAIPVSDRQKKEFCEIAPEYKIVFTNKEDITQMAVKEASVIIGNVAPALLKYAEKLEWLQLNSAGTDPYTKEGILPQGVLLTNASGAYGVAVSEHMMALTLMLIKKLHLYRDNMNAGCWRDEGSVTSLTQSQVLVLGTGDIGGEYAKRMQLLGSRVYGIRRNTGEIPPYFEAIYGICQLENILPEMDIVAVTLPGSSDLYHLFDEKKINVMKDGAVFINAGRGNLVDTAALVQALNTGKLGAAALDVTDPEPLLADSPLWKLPNLMITPHVAGGFHLRLTLDKIIQIAQQNMHLFQSGELNARNCRH